MLFGYYEVVLRYQRTNLNIVEHHSMNRKEEVMKEIKEKAEYCLNCKTKPCQKGCPLENNIPDFIAEVKKGEIEKAYQILSKTTVLQPVCGLICPHMSQCQGGCVRRFKGNPTSIGEMEAYIGKIALEHNIPYEKETKIKKEKKVAVVGGGPAGLTCSAFLARKGYDVTIFEKHEKLRRNFIPWDSRISFRSYCIRKNNSENNRLRN